VLDAHLIAAADAVSAHISELLGAREADEQRMRDMFAAWADTARPWGSAAE
jgi:hypothetical protein